ncbi:MAG TPA: hypothetical protein PLG66_13715, partial [Calditrichia bacterium]|nr:hypothetical protein [Calditrichia bacterium]
MPARVLIAILVSLLLAVPQLPGQQPIFTPLGDLPGGSVYSKAYGTSADGTVIVGEGQGSSGTLGFIWREGQGMVSVGGFPGQQVRSFLWDVSSDGSTAVGFGDGGVGGDSALVWSAGNGISGIGELPDGSNSVARGISEDGSTIVGQAANSFAFEPFRWTASGGMVGLGSFSGIGFGGTAWDVSQDGSVLVGYSTDGAGDSWAFRWTAAGGLTNLGSFTGNPPSYAYGVSDDGNVVVGKAVNGSFQAFRWTTGEGMVNLGTLDGRPQSEAWAANRDGSVIVGTSGPVFVWTAATGMRALSEILTDDYGVDLSGWTLLGAYDISPDGRVIVGYGQNPQGNSEAFRVVLPAIAIAAPQTGDRWVGEGQGTIRWKAPGVNFFSIDLSLDDGSSWKNIDFSTTPGDTQFVYRVPDTLFTTNTARIRVSDLYDSTRFAISEPFTIKGYDHSRILSDGSLQHFRTPQNGWFFRNDTTNMWPQAWWRQFIYLTATDPYTNEHYPEDWFQTPVNARSWNFVDWPVFVEAFGEDQCYWSTTAGVYRGAAVGKWRTRKHRWGGSCYGLATSSLLAFSYPAEFRNRFPVVAQTDSIYRLNMTNSIRKVINRHFVHQYGRVALDNDVVGRNKTPRDLLFEVRQMFLDDTRLPRALSFFNPGPGGGAHTVVPTHLRRDPTIASSFRLFVYDSNNPGDVNRFIYIDSTANTWTDSVGLNWGTGTQKCYLEPTIDNFLQAPVLGSALPGKRQHSFTDGYVELSATEFANTVIRNSPGQSLGWVDSSIIEEIPGAIPIIPKVGGPAAPLGYYLPGEPYTIEMSNLTDSLVYFSADFDSVNYSYDRIGGAAGQTERITLQAGLSVTNPDAGIRPIRLGASSIGDTRERQAQAAELALQGGDSLNLEMIDAEQVLLKNFGGNKTYRLTLQESSAGAAAVFYHEQIQLADNS